MLCIDGGGVNWVGEWEQKGLGLFFFEIFARDKGGTNGVLGFLSVVPVA